jgi:hypothetical protein
VHLLVCDNKRIFETHGATIEIKKNTVALFEGSLDVMLVLLRDSKGVLWQEFGVDFGGRISKIRQRMQH